MIKYNKFSDEYLYEIPEESKDHLLNQTEQIGYSSTNYIIYISHSNKDVNKNVKKYEIEKIEENKKISNYQEDEIYIIVKLFNDADKDNNWNPFFLKLHQWIKNANWKFFLLAFNKISTDKNELKYARSKLLESALQASINEFDHVKDKTELCKRIGYLIQSGAVLQKEHINKLAIQGYYNLILAGIKHANNAKNWDWYMLLKDIQGIEYKTFYQEALNQKNTIFKTELLFYNSYKKFFDDFDNNNLTKMKEKLQGVSYYHQGSIEEKYIQLLIDIKQQELDIEIKKRYDISLLELTQLNLPSVLKKHRLTIISQLLDNGATLLRNSSITSDYAIHFAVKYKDIELIKLLIKKDPKILLKKNKNNQIALDFASNLEILELLIPHFTEQELINHPIGVETLTTILLNAFQQGDVIKINSALEIIKSLGKLGVEGKYGRLLLELANINFSEEYLKKLCLETQIVLIKNNAELTWSMGKTKNTAIHLAAKGSNLSLIDAIIKNKKDRQILLKTNVANEIALDLASNIETLKILIPFYKDEELNRFPRWRKTITILLLNEINSGETVKINMALNLIQHLLSEEQAQRILFSLLLQVTNSDLRDILSNLIKKENIKEIWTDIINLMITENKSAFEMICEQKNIDQLIKVIPYIHTDEKKFFENTIELYNIKLQLRKEQQKTEKLDFSLNIIIKTIAPQWNESDTDHLHNIKQMIDVWHKHRDINNKALYQFNQFTTQLLLINNKDVQYAVIRTQEDYQKNGFSAQESVELLKIRINTIKEEELKKSTKIPILSNSLFKFTKKDTLLTKLNKIEMPTIPKGFGK
jgi:hypothetical protein